ncbi:hypothetical protein SAMN04488595_10545 [Ralstonia sp. 25mfcol4.1]|uniref:hypothetical protein n=1 Tax=Burkholderiaceae TaxID=119060 RepID=UPI000890B386|nr:hypothetical protein [Ralstonia sp. 25mfcol4.1]SDP14947.1 hypothetical protein SAMN04488595_10545 [Ralstonia sp. 25mfcol4.1]
MKSALLALCGAASLLASLSAVAGPDFAVIERARANAHQRQQVKPAACHCDTAAGTGPGATTGIPSASAPKAALAPIHTS